MTIRLTAFRWVPAFAQGYVRDLRIRWALEEAGLPYEVTLIDPRIQASDSYRHWQPFGQVPAYKDDKVEMFESGAIVLHIAAMSEALAPRDEAGRARVTTWVVAALNSIEPFAQNFIQIADSDAYEDWVKAQRAPTEALLTKRLAALSAWLGEKGYDPLFGARPLARIIQEHIKKPLAEELLFGSLAKGGLVRVTVDKEADKLAFSFAPRPPAPSRRPPRPGQPGWWSLSPASSRPRAR